MKNKNNKIGQLLMIGISGPKLTQEEKKFLRKVHPSGVIYFRRNVQTVKQLEALSLEIVDNSSFVPLIAIDQEGGKVARLGAPFTEFPGNAYLGRIKDPKMRVAYTMGQARVMARELKMIGVNYNFTPVADINTNPKNPIIGGLGRSFSEDPKVVAELVEATVKTYKKEKVVSCAKHFPGHGDTFSDSHKVLPAVNTSRNILMKRELIPFRAAIRAKVPTMMTAHVVYKTLDPKYPATLSHKILNELLRKKMRYQGVIVSDDLEMNAIAKHGDIDEAGIQAMLAGADMLLVCKSLERSEEVFEKLVRTYESNSTFRNRANESLKRVSILKKNYLGWMKSKWPKLQPEDFKEHSALSQRIKELGDAKFI